MKTYTREECLKIISDRIQDCDPEIIYGIICATEQTIQNAAHNRELLPVISPDDIDELIDILVADEPEPDQSEKCQRFHDLDGMFWTYFSINLIGVRYGLFDIDHAWMAASLRFTFYLMGVPFEEVEQRFQQLIAPQRQLRSILKNIQGAM